MNNVVLMGRLVADPELKQVKYFIFDKVTVYMLT